MAAWLATMAAGGCLLVNDFDEITGGAADTGTLTPILDAAEGDAAEADAAVDAGFSCAGHRECLTFDDGKLEVNGWNQTNSGNGSMALDQTLFVSPPAGARSRFEATDGGASPQNGSIMDKTLVIEPAPTHMRWGFDINLGDCSLPSSGGAGSVTLTSIFPSTLAAFGLIIGSRNDDLIGHSNQDSGVFTSNRLPRPLPRRAWAHLDFDLRISAKSSELNLYVDSELWLTSQFPEAPPANRILLNMGALSSGRVNACDVAYDNYYFDVVP